MIETWKLFFDGSCWPNPDGTAAFGYLLCNPNGTNTKGHRVIGSGHGMTNNVAEFHALAEGLWEFEPYTWDLEPRRLEVFGDSQMVINIMSGAWRARPDKAYYLSYEQAKLALSSIRCHKVSVSFTWIPREENSLCDELSKAHNRVV